MAIINLRVEDHLKDRLQKRASEKGITLSEFIREIILTYRFDDDSFQVGDEVHIILLER